MTRPEADSGNVELQELLRRHEELQEERWIADLGDVLKTRPGRAVVYRLVYGEEYGRLLCLSHLGDDERETLIREGQRRMGQRLQVLAQMHYPELSTQMVEDAIRLQREAAINRQAALEAAKEE